MSKENRIDCPFCGGEMVRPFIISRYMRCTNCGAQSPFTHNLTDVEKEARKRADGPKGEWTENDLIRRGDVLAMAAEYECEDYNDMAVSVDDINDIPAAPQPLSAVEYERERGRFLEWCDQHYCDSCEYENNCPSSYRATPEERVEAILKWAQDHPQEVAE